MTASEGSFIGFAKQTAKGTPNVTDADFKYLLFTGGGISPAPVVTPLDMEVGGGALLRDVVKTGIVSGGRLQFIPRPDTLGLAFMGMTGNVQSAAEAASLTAKRHIFTLGADQFAAPYYTGRQAPGNMWGEQLQDMRFNSLALSWRGGQFVRGECGLVGGLPKKVSAAAWSALSKVDGGPQFLAPLGTIELPTATPLSVLAGSFVASSQIPLDEQWIVGSYSPEGFDIVQRAYMLQLAVKITEGSLYTKLMYDPAGGSDWLAAAFREADFKLKFASEKEADEAIPYSFEIKANGDNAASGTANVVWTAQPIAMQPGRQIIMNVVGTFLADPGGASPISLELVNTTATY